MGELFVARHGLTGFEKQIVIKKVLPDLAADKEFLTRFIDEAQVAIQLQHANIAQVFEVGRVEDEYFLAIEYVEGRDLRATLAALDDAGRSMPPQIALHIAREVAAGLAYAHRRTDSAGELLDLVHCDISPPNVMLSFDGETKIIDFGIARSAQRRSQTDPNRGFGKFGYMSPEQLSRGAAVDHRTDVYAVGVLLFEMLTGRKLFEIGDEPDYQALARKVIRGEHPLPGEIDPALARFDGLVGGALAAAVDDRFQSAAELRDAIQTQLVAVDPTFNADHLAAFLRELFGERRATRRLDPRMLDHWKRELTQQAATTVSFARAPGSRPRSSTLPGRLAEGTPSEESRGVTLEHESAPAGRIARPSHRVIRDGAAIGVALIAGAVATALVVRLSDDGPAPARVAAKVAPAEVAAPIGAAPVPAEPPAVAVNAPIVTPLTEGSRAPATPAPPVVEIDDGPVRLAGPERAPAERASSPRRERPRRAARTAPPARVAAGAARPTEAKDVEGHFRAAHAEYQDFKRRFGTRLEREWNDLAHFATFGRSPDKLGEFDRQIQSFRQLMRSVGDRAAPLINR